MSEYISDFKLEQWLQGELSAKESERIESAIQSDPVVHNRVEEMKRQGQELLDQYPPNAFRRDVEQKWKRLVAQEAHQETSQWILGSWKPFAGVLAVCLAIFVIVPPFLGEEESGSGGDNSYRIKGDAVHLMVHLVENDTQKQQLVGGERVQAGDRIQLSIRQAKGRSFVVFSIDGSGVLTPHYPMGDKAKREEKPFFSLPTSYQLDDAPAFETFYLVSAEEELIKSDLLAKAKQALKSTSFLPSFRALLPKAVLVNEVSLKKDEQ